MGDEPRTSRGLLGFASADRSIKVVRGDEGRIERYRVILPRRDAAGWQMAEVEGPEERIELISPELCGSLGIHLSVVTLAPGVHDRPHWHAQGEKVMYITTGRGAILAGEALERLDVSAGDAVYVPPFAIHAPPQRRRRTSDVRHGDQRPARRDGPGRTAAGRGVITKGGEPR